MTESPLRVEVVPEPVAAELGPELRSALLNHPVIRSHYPNADLWVVNLDLLDKDGEGSGENSPFRATLVDLAGSDVVEAEGMLWDLDNLVVTPTSRPRLPSEEERAWAVEVLRHDADLAARIDGGEVEVYWPSPPLANTQDDDGSVIRAVTVGLRESSATGGASHRLVAVRSDDGEVVEIGAPSDREGGLPDAPPCPPAGEGEAQARVKVFRGEDLLWELVVVRPSASSGATGSGVELRSVDYQRGRMLHRGHLPIVNVGYDDGRASREWLSDESCFEAEGEEPVPGFRVCTAPPRTIFDRGEGGGEFRGVAVWVDGEEVVLVSQLEAGWYRYVCEWRLHADGTIRPRVGFGAVRNPATWQPHTHHAYWRLDFDVLAPRNNQIQEHNDPTLPGQLAPWHTIRYEVARRRVGQGLREWRVRSVRSPHGYAITPGPRDGIADHFGAGDVWIVAHHGDELDDGEGVTTDPARARAHLDRLVSGELVEREDVVVWYGVHVRHGGDAADGDGGGDLSERVGPDLQAFMWKPPTEKQAYVPLAPPPTPGPDEDEDE